MHTTVFCRYKIFSVRPCLLLSPLHNLHAPICHIYSRSTVLHTTCIWVNSFTTLLASNAINRFAAHTSANGKVLVTLASLQM